MILLPSPCPPNLNWKSYEFSGSEDPALCEMCWKR